MSHHPEIRARQHELSWLTLRVFPDAVLRENCAPIEQFDSTLRDLLAEMLVLMRARNGIVVVARFALRIAAFETHAAAGAQVDRRHEQQRGAHKASAKKLSSRTAPEGVRAIGRTLRSNSSTPSERSRLWII